MFETGINAVPFLFFNSISVCHSGKMRSCVCMTSWCNLARTKHLFGSRTVILTCDKLERQVWVNHLESTADSFDYLGTLVDPRVWVGHFHMHDYIISSDDEGNASFAGIDFKSITKFRESDTGRSSLSSPPRPAATKISVSQSFLSDCRKVSFEDYRLQGASVDRRRRQSKIKVSVLATPTSTPTPTPTSTSTAPVGRTSDVPFFESFIGISENIVSLMRSMNSHGHICTGALHFRRCEVTNRRLALTVKCSCSLAKSCKLWSSGVFRWQST